MDTSSNKHGHTSDPSLQSSTCTRPADLHENELNKTDDAHNVLVPVSIVPLLLIIVYDNDINPKPFKHNCVALQSNA